MVLLHDKYWQRLRGDIIRLMIGETDTEMYDPVLVRLTPRIVEKGGKSYYCMLCNKYYDTYRSIFYHIATVHAEEVEEIAIRYRLEKLKKLGIVESISRGVRV